MLIYKNYNQAGLNRQFNNRAQTPHYSIYSERAELRNRQTEKEFPVIKDIAYGGHSREKLDIYPSAQPHSKTLLFIHGGYWKSMDKSNFQFIAGGFHSYNITTVLITYPLAPAVTMDEIVDCCRRGLNWVYTNIAKYNGDPEQLYIAGHSAGGHLAAMLLAHETGHRLSIKGACLLSGLFNLIPVQLSDINDTVQMNTSMAIRNSPVTMRPVYNCPLLLTVGGDETDEFKVQSKKLYESWKNLLPVQLLEIKGENHYSIVECFADQESELHKAFCAIMKNSM